MADLATDLKAWLAATGRKGSDRVFRVPLELVKIMRRDLKRSTSRTGTIGEGLSMSTPCGTRPQRS